MVKSSFSHKIVIKEFSECHIMSWREILLKKIFKQSNINLIHIFRIVNNISWCEQMNIINFLRICKPLTVARMLQKKSVENRIDKGLSFTEFSYQVSIY